MRVAAGGGAADGKAVAALPHSKEKSAGLKIFDYREKAPASEGRRYKGKRKATAVRLGRRTLRGKKKSPR
jgi:hypothetical protein